VTGAALGALWKLFIKSLLVLPLIVGVVDGHESLLAGVIPTSEQAVSIAGQLVGKRDESEDVEKHFFRIIFRDNGFKPPRCDIAGHHYISVGDDFLSIRHDDNEWVAATFWVTNQVRSQHWQTSFTPIDHTNGVFNCCSVATYLNELGFSGNWLVGAQIDWLVNFTFWISKQIDDPELGRKGETQLCFSGVGLSVSLGSGVPGLDNGLFGLFQRPLTENNGGYGANDSDKGEDEGPKPIAPLFFMMLAFFGIPMFLFGAWSMNGWLVPGFLCGALGAGVSVANWALIDFWPL